MAESQSAVLFRMVLPDHTCPFGLRTRDLLEQAGFAVDDRILAAREDVDAFETEQGAVIHAGAARAGQAAKSCNNMLLGASMLAGVEGLEPPALGFGDRCSTN